MNITTGTVLPVHTPPRKKESGDLILLRGIDNYTQPELDDLKRRRDAGMPEAILSICVSMTSACNIRCWYCYALGNKKVNPEQLRLQEYLDLIDQAAELGAKTLVVCGDGEPTYDPLLLPVVSHAFRNYGMTPVVVTNGTIFGADRISMARHRVDGSGLASFLYDHGASLLVKLETLDATLYEATVGIEDSWHWFDTGVRRIVDAGFGKTWQEPAGTFSRLSFTGIATKDNFGEIPSMRAWARSLGAQYICKVPSPTGGALDCIGKLFPVNEVAEVRDYVDQFSDKRETLTPIILDADKCMTCLAWHLGPVITETGHYVECYTSTDHSFGNIREKSLRELLRDKKKESDFTSPCPIKDRLYVNLAQIQRSSRPTSA
jgi:MoaA/NifB/PqqE/SkfB family radical SAM enzyme